MTEHFWLGMAIIFLSGVFNGIFALPMKFSRRWRWENTWLVFALVAMIILPWLLAVRFAPELRSVYLGVSTRTLLVPLAFGLLLGITQVTYGLGIKAVGIAVAIAVVSGVSCFFGALVPLLVFNPADLVRPRGLLLLVSMPILFLGLAFYGKAGRRREKEQAASELAPSAVAAWSFATGLGIVIFTGTFGSSINLGFAFSGGILRRSLELGASPLTSTYAVWALLFSASFIPNLVYCSYLLTRHRGWALFSRPGWRKEALLAAGMAVLSLTAFVGYGIGATLVGKYGTSVGWALFAASSILASNGIGIVMGEWKDTSQATRRLLGGAVTATAVSVVVLNLGGIF